MKEGERKKERSKQVRKEERKGTRKEKGGGEKGRRGDEAMKGKKREEGGSWEGNKRQEIKTELSAKRNFCGKKCLACPCCGHCGPTNGCSCFSYQESGNFYIFLGRKEVSKEGRNKGR